MTDFLWDYERKRGRAMFHLDVLTEIIEGARRRNRDRVLGEYNRDSGQYVFEAPLEPLPEDVPLVLGDFIQNRRASLDYLITALIHAASNEEHERSQFPIYGINRIGWQDIDKWWEDDPSGVIERNLEGTPPGTKAALKKLQPFYGGPFGGANPMAHPLFKLQAMSNRDKHRRLNLLENRAAVDFVDARGERLFYGPKGFGRIAESRERDTYTATLRTDEKPDVDVYLLPSYDVAFGEPPELVDVVLDVLTDINKFIDRGVLPTIRGLMG
jgi:hypothetical protein